MLQMKCLNSLAEVTCINRSWNQEVCRRGRIRETASRLDQIVLRLFVHMESIVWAEGC